ncbi:MAG: 30S ribosome-binding factor RbfA [Halothiobacillaceae bacterium]|jgi:ribosome-binding factor A|nr:30S ribosome-binding factor RbfA [Halothiobacillaceae bacterium]MDY0049831.1 30S ribosome-binding factor RbfA [Halothiobacillaceae bacterium]
MAREFPRSARVADQIQRDLSELIRTEIKDPRLGMVTLTAVEVTRDLAHAKVYISTLDPAQRAVALEVLGGAAGYLRAELARGLRLRTTPALHFIYDESIERGMRMDAIIDAARARDRAHDGDEDEQPGGGEA